LKLQEPSLFLYLQNKITEFKNDLKSYRNTGFIDEINPKDKYILLSEV